jgi:hypothetical protein
MCGDSAIGISGGAIVSVIGILPRPAKLGLAQGSALSTVPARTSLSPDRLHFFAERAAV